MKNIEKVLLLVLVLILSVTACTSQVTDVEEPDVETESESEPEAELEPIYIASTAPLTGSDVYQWEVNMKVIQMAMDEINAAGGLLGGRQLVLEYFDDAGDPAQGVPIIQQIVDNPKYVALIGPVYSGVTLAALELTSSANLPQITAASNYLNTEQGAKNLFIVSINDSLMGPVAAEYLYNDLGVRSVAAVHNKTSWGQGVVDNFVRRAEELGMTITSYQGIDADSADYTAVLTKLKNENPDAIYVGLYTEAGRFRKQMIGLGMKDVIFMGAEIDGAEIMDVAGDTLVGALTVSSAPDRHPETADELALDFIQRCNDAFGLNPEPWSFFYYESVYILADAITRAGTTEKQAVIDALRASKFEGKVMKGFEFSFDEKGRPKKPVTFIWECTEAGVFEQIARIDTEYPD